MFRFDFSKIFPLLFLTFAFFLTSCGEKYSGKKAPLVKGGMLDLSKWDFKADGPVELKGVWNFAWKTSLDKSNPLLPKPDKVHPLTVPGSWVSDDTVIPYDPRGYGVYWLHIKLPKQNQVGANLKVLIPTVGSSAAVYTAYNKDEKLDLTLNLGFPDLDAAKNIPTRKGDIFEFKNLSGELTLAIEIVNRHVGNGGLWFSPQIGLSNDVSNHRANQISVGTFMIGVLFIMGLYHLGLFILRSKDYENLFFASFCFDVAIRNLSMVEGGWFLADLFNNDSFAGFVVEKRFEYVSWLLGCPLLYLFINSAFPGMCHPYLVRFIVISCFSMAFAALFIAPVLFTNFQMPYIAIVFIGILYLLFKLFKEAFSGNATARIAAIGFLFFAIGLVNDMIHAMGLIRTMHLYPYAMTFFIFSQSYLLALKFSNALDTAEHLSVNLKTEVETQTIELREQTNAAMTAKEDAQVAQKKAEAAKAEADKLKLAAEEDAKKLKELDKQKTHFFQNISHELRTPLTLIMTPLDQAKESHKDDHNIDIAAKNSKRLYRLVNQLLDFQKVSAGKKELKLRPVNLKVFLEKCGEYFKLSCDAKNIKFSFSFPDTEKSSNEDILVMAEVDSLEKIIFNYLSNALKYTPSKGSIELGFNFKNDKQVSIFVKDSGPGIAKEQQEKLFKVFSQVDEATTREYEGTGLGLALTKELVLKMNGDVFVKSAPGEGSEFGFYLKLKSGIKPVKELLVVDDDPDVIFGLETTIVANFPEWKVSYCNSAKEAREQLKHNDYQCVLSDARMPKESGVSLLKYVHEEMPSVRKVLLTGFADKEDLKKATNEAKVDFVLYKPWSNSELCEILGRLVSSYDLDDDEIENNFVIKDWHLEAVEKTGEAEEEQFSEVASTNSAKILVVDDIKDMRDLIAGSLKGAGYKLFKASNGKDGLDKASKIRPDLIVSDWMMPVMSGPDLIKEIRAKDEISSTPVILLTAKSDEESKLAGTEIGADAFLGKPFNEAELVSTVRNLIQLKKGERRIKELNRHITENVLKRYLPAELVDDVLSGRVSFEKDPEMKEITVLFSDLAGFTGLSSRLGAEKTAMILNDYLNRMIGIIGDHGGTIDKFIGDAIMVFWGAPKDMHSKEQVNCAANCARAMQKAMVELNENWTDARVSELKMRIGIHNGSAVVGNFGNEKRSDYSAIGPDVNLASRIESVCTPGEVFASNKIVNLLNEDSFVEAGQFDLKGIKEKFKLYKIL